MGRELTEEEKAWLVDGLDFVAQGSTSVAPAVLEAWRRSVEGFRVLVDSADWDLESFLMSFEAPADCEPKAFDQALGQGHYREGLQVVVDRTTRAVTFAGLWNVSS